MPDNGDIPRTNNFSARRDRPILESSLVVVRGGRAFRTVDFNIAYKFAIAYFCLIKPSGIITFF
ncbi:hypothetical protein [Microcoleus sp. F4-D5]|uniref:hypothetical protein n=1 Tax=Microcoleus sp. F4-D5 TaxID=2818760 RepID=UPI002FCF63FE